MADRNDIIIHGYLGIITEADKARAVVIIDVKDYVKEAQGQLNNKDVYKKL